MPVSALGLCPGCGLIPEPGCAVCASLRAGNDNLAISVNIHQEQQHLSAGNGGALTLLYV